MRKLLSMAIVALTMFSCGGGKTDLLNQAGGMAKLNEILTSEFGKDCYYQTISVTSTEMGDIINVVCSKDPSSLKMEEWMYAPAQGWSQNSEISMTIPEGTTADEFMYQLDKDFTLAKIEESLVSSCKTIVDEGKLGSEIIAKSLLIKTNDRTKDELNYLISVEPKNGGTKTLFTYDKSGQLSFRN